MYKLTKPFNEEVRTIIWQKDNEMMCIPVDENNIDYQKYLKWLDGYELVGLEWVKTSDSNEPLPADE